MQKINECHLCESEKLKLLFKLTDRLYRVPGFFYFSKCKKCGLIFQNPRLSEEELSPYYPKDYVAYDFKKDGRNNMISLLYHTYYSSNGNPLLKILFLPVRGLLRSMPKRKGARYLDIGCGGGNFLRLVKDVGMEPNGVDPFLDEPSKELGIRNVNFLDAKYPSNYFDFITLNTVFEHVPNPCEILLECKRVLKNNGKIFVNVPNSSSLGYRLFKSNWVSLDPPRHLFIFSNPTLKMYAEKTGLQIERTNYKSETFAIIGSLIYLFNNILGKKTKLAESKIMANPLVNLAFLPVAVLFNLFKIGDQTEAVFVKNLNEA